MSETKKYLAWGYAGGPNECKHGYAAGIACPGCDAEKAAQPPSGEQPAKVESGEGLPPLPNPYRQNPPVYSMIPPEQRKKWKKKWATMDDEECKREHYKHYEWECRKVFEELEARETQLLAKVQEVERLKGLLRETKQSINELFQGGFIEAGVKENCQWSQELDRRLVNLRKAAVTGE